MASIIKNTGIASLGRVVNIALGVGITALLTRMLGVEEYGIYALLLSFAGVFQVMADFGLYLTLTKEIAQQPEDSPTFISHIFLVRICLLLFFFAVSFLIIPFLPSLKPFVFAYGIVLGSLALQSMSQLAMGIYQSKSSMWSPTAGDFLGRVTQFLGLLALSLLSAKAVSITRVVAPFFLGIFVAAAVHYIYLPLRPKIRFEFSKETVKRIVAISWPLGVMLLLNVIYFRIDIIMLSMFRSEYEVGLYGLGYKIIENLLFFPAMFGGLLLPHVSAAIAKKQTEKIRDLVSQAVQISLWAGLIVGLMLGVFAKTAVVILSGVSFIAATPIVAVLSMALCCMVIGNVFGFTLVALGKRMTLVKLYAGLVLFNVLGNVVFIPLYGPVAAAWTTVATELLAMTIAGMAVWRQTHFILPRLFILKLAIVTFGAVAVLFSMPLGWNDFVRITVVVVMIGVLTIWLRLLSKKDFSLLFSA